MNAVVTTADAYTLDSADRRLIEAIQEGLPLTTRPYAAIGRDIGMSEAQVINRLQNLLVHGFIKRLGVVVRHHELGYNANAMVVWDIADSSIDSIAIRLKSFDFVTLCYQRPRRLPDWPYNLFCMIHGRSREKVLEHVQQLVTELELDNDPHQVLFSRRRFKQCGARFAGLAQKAS